jgi:hypothetical protein
MSNSSFMYMVLDQQFYYEGKLIIPFELGLQLVTLIQQAEVFKDSYSSDKGIRELKSSDLSIKFMSEQEYAEHKLNSVISPP